MARRKRAPARAQPEPAAEHEEPARSDLQPTDQPCTECYPDGWPDQVFSLGCTHGTWIRPSN